MTGFITTDSRIGSPHFGHAWRDQYGNPFSTVQLGEEANTRLTFTDPAAAREVAAACIAAAQAMEALPPLAETGQEVPGAQDRP